MENFGFTFETHYLNVLVVECNVPLLGMSFVRNIARLVSFVYFTNYVDSIK